MKSIDRFQEIPHEGPMCDYLWSDPDDNIDEWEQNTRGAGVLFGSKLVDRFLNNNDIDLIVRAHQLIMEGFKLHFGNKLITIWSAPNYCYRCGNKAGILKLDKNKQRTSITFDSVPKSKESATIKTLVPYFL